MSDKSLVHFVFIAFELLNFSNWVTKWMKYQLKLYNIKRHLPFCYFLLLTLCLSLILFLVWGQDSCGGRTEVNLDFHRAGFVTLANFLVNVISGEESFIPEHTNKALIRVSRAQLSLKETFLIAWKKMSNTCTFITWVIVNSKIIVIFLKINKTEHKTQFLEWYIDYKHIETL